MWNPLNIIKKRNADTNQEPTSEMSLMHWIDMATADGASLDEEFGLNQIYKPGSVE